MKKFVLTMMKEMEKNGGDAQTAREVARKSMCNPSPLEREVNALQDELTVEIAKMAEAAEKVEAVAAAKRAADAALMPPPKRVKNAVSSREESDLIAYFLAQQPGVESSRTRGKKMKPVRKPLVEVVDQTKKQ